MDLQIASSATILMARFDPSVREDALPPHLSLVRRNRSGAVSEPPFQPWLTFPK